MKYELNLEQGVKRQNKHIHDMKKITKTKQSRCLTVTCTRLASCGVKLQPLPFARGPLCPSRAPRLGSCTHGIRQPRCICAMGKAPRERPKTGKVEYLTVDQRVRDRNHSGCRQAHGRCCDHGLIGARLQRQEKEGLRVSTFLATILVKVHHAEKGTKNTPAGPSTMDPTTDTSRLRTTKTQTHTYTNIQLRPHCPSWERPVSKKYFTRKKGPQ